MRNFGNIFFGLLGIFLLVNGCFDLLHTYSATRWPYVPGIVASSELSGRKTRTPRITFNYSVNGIAHHGATYRFGVPFLFGQQEVLHRYPAGFDVTVFYNPADPAEAVLETGPGSGNFQSIGLALAMCGIAGFSIFRNAARESED